MTEEEGRMGKRSRGEEVNEEDERGIRTMDNHGKRAAKMREERRERKTALKFPGIYPIEYRKAYFVRRT